MALAMSSRRRDPGGYSPDTQPRPSEPPPSAPPGRPAGHQPKRGSDVEAWLKARRDEQARGTHYWFAIDNLLDRYRLHADTGVPLGDPLGEEADHG